MYHYFQWLVVSLANTSRNLSNFLLWVCLSVHNNSVNQYHLAFCSQCLMIKARWFMEQSCFLVMHSIVTEWPWCCALNYRFSGGKLWSSLKFQTSTAQKINNKGFHRLSFKKHYFLPERFNICIHLNITHFTVLAERWLAVISSNFSEHITWATSVMHNLFHQPWMVSLDCTAASFLVFGFVKIFCSDDSKKICWIFCISECVLTLIMLMNVTILPVWPCSHHTDDTTPYH